MKKVGLISLGCPKNRVDSEYILGNLDHLKYQVTNNIDEADIVFINTCGFINPSKQESIQTILENIDGKKKIVVTGCLVERYLKQLKKEIPEVDLWIPIKDYPIFNQRLEELDNSVKETTGLDYHYRMLSTGPVTAYLRIGEGCSNHCSYCAIPLIRGEYRSRPLDEIIKEATLLAGQGIKEIVVLEQDTSKYGIDLKEDITLVTLLKSLLALNAFESIRLLYLYPDEVSDELIDLISEDNVIEPYFDIPIQHSEDHILKAMNRRGTKKDLITLFNNIKTKCPKAILRTTVMVGFPGETKQDVDNLVKFMKDIKFDHLGAFSYSKEEDTASYNYPHQVKESTKQKRLDEVMKTQQGISYIKNKSHIGEIMTGFIYEYSNGYYLFRSYYNAPDDVDDKIFVKSNKLISPGTKVKVKITDAFVYDLIAELVD